MTSIIATPTGLAALVRIETVRVNGRHRRVLGDLVGLAKSISDVGLLHPVTLTRDSCLVAGHRRLEACRLLGWSEVPARFVDTLDDAAALLRAERDENTCRKDMLPSELASLGEALYALEAAQARQRQGTRTDLGHQLPSSESGKLEAAEAVGQALGMSRATYHELRQVYRAAADPEGDERVRELARAALERMDHGAGIQPTGRQFRRQQRQLRGERETGPPERDEPPAADSGDPPSEPDDTWVPPLRDSSARAVQQRLALLAQHAARGLTSAQIGDAIGGVLPTTVRRTAVKHGIAIPADEAMGRGTRKGIDSNRVVEKTVMALDALAEGAQLVDLDALDRDQIKRWVSSLTTSIRSLNQLVRAMKEKTQ